jgi:hypothetical protein
MNTMTWLIGGSIALQAACAVIAALLAVRSPNGSWRFWCALMAAFVGIIVHRSFWMLGDLIPISPILAKGLSLAATYFVSLAFLAAMGEAVMFHRQQRQKIYRMSEDIIELDRRLQEREHGRRTLGTTAPTA